MVLSFLCPDRPHNPMVNAGAIVTLSLLKRGFSPADRFDYVSKFDNVCVFVIDIYGWLPLGQYEYGFKLLCKWIGSRSICMQGDKRNDKREVLLVQFVNINKYFL